MDEVTIPRKEYDELVDAKLHLDALLENGVDNWQWYDDAMDTYHEKKGQQT